MSEHDDPSEPARRPHWYLKEPQPEAGAVWQILAFVSLLILASGATSLVFGFYPYFAAQTRYQGESSTSFNERRNAILHEAPNAFRNRLLAGLAIGSVGAAVAWFVVRRRIREEDAQDHR